MERMKRVDFYEIWDNGTLLADVGVYGFENENDANIEGQRIAALISPTAVATFDRTGIVFAE